MQKASKRVLRILFFMMRTEKEVNHGRIGGVLSFIGMPWGLLSSWLIVTFPDNYWVLSIVAVSAVLFFCAAYLLIVCQVLRGRWRWFSNYRGD